MEATREPWLIIAGWFFVILVAVLGGWVARIQGKVDSNCIDLARVKERLRMDEDE